jgi:glutathione synthase/RimK-type ligase-like ATP-grasp enzyme
MSVPDVVPFTIAMLIDPEEELPPSDEDALRYFESAAHMLYITLIRVTPDDMYAGKVIPDALFIRMTTYPDGVAYKLACWAEAAGIPVIDDPESIKVCTDKAEFTRRMQARGTSMPRTCILSKDTEGGVLHSVVKEFGLPLILKTPEGCFSRGVFKVSNLTELALKAQTLLQDREEILVQEFVPTEFDWRIGVLNGQALWACKYYMAPEHWQIYDHKHGGKCGKFDTVKFREVPPEILKLALEACSAIGDGLYGVDLKERDGKFYVIEVNDNPNIDGDVEDLVMGTEIYARILMHLFAKAQTMGVEKHARVG